MRLSRSFVGVLLLGAALVAAAEPAFAQSLLQRLFGFGRARTPDYRSEDRPEFRPGYSYNRLGAYDAYGRPYDGGWEEDTASYRTVCVRLCDGFYFPIGDNVRRERLHADSRACTQRCDGEARLYFYPTRGGSPATMVDLAGRSYATLPNAFQYRKALVEGCTCKPAPWSPEEAARHQGYAAQQAQNVAGADPEHPSGQPAEAARTAASDVYTEPQDPDEREPAYQSRWQRGPWGRPRYGWRD